MRYLTKNRALLSAAALLAGVSLASAQGQQKETPGAGGSSPGMSSGSGGASAPSAAPSGGGEKMDRGQAQRPSAPDRTTGQGSSQSSNPGASESKSVSEPKAAPKAGKAAQDKSATDKAAQDKGGGKAAQDKAAQDKAKSTTGQGTREGSRDAAQPSDKSKASGKSEPAQRQQSQTPSDSKASDSKSGTTGTGAATQSQPGSASTQGSATLDAQKQTSIQQSVLSARNAPRVTNVNFSISTGTVIPRHVRFVSLSTYPILIETFPQYRDYSFFIVEEEIVIIEPRTRKIVHVVPVGSGRASRGGGTSVEVLQLSEPEIREVQLVLVQRGLLQRTYVTGVLDERTKTALITFQRKEGLSASGSIDTRTVSSLGLSGKVGQRAGRFGCVAHERPVERTGTERFAAFGTAAVGTAAAGSERFAAARPEQLATAAAGHDRTGSGSEQPERSAAERCAVRPEQLRSEQSGHHGERACAISGEEGSEQYGQPGAGAISVERVCASSAPLRRGFFFENASHNTSVIARASGRSSCEEGTPRVECLPDSWMPRLRGA